MEGHLERLRREEIELIRGWGWLKPGLRVLDLGGGSGYQASLMHAYGCDVTSIDLAGRPMPSTFYFPVDEYDGITIPHEDASFELVFSSNVLEHVHALRMLLDEVRRVLKPGGVTIHVVPSAGWRFWTSVSHYGFVVKSLIGKQGVIPAAIEPVSPRQKLQRHGVVFMLKRILLAGPHGEYPNALAELHYFSRRRWLQVFANARFVVIDATDNKLFYTGYTLLPRLTMARRRWLARFLGSSCHVFVLRAATQGVAGPLSAYI